MNNRRCTAHNRRGEQCGRSAAPGRTVCNLHGGKSPGAPIVHALYSNHVPADWREPYEYFKSDPEYLSLRAEIALAQTNMSRYLKLCEGATFSADMREHLIAHLEHIGKLKERENKRVYQESVVSELLSKQAQAEAGILKQVLSKYVDADTAERAAAEFADMVEQSAGVGAGIQV